jgi:hypothetical protein
MLSLIGKLLLSFGFEKLAAWLGVKREVKQAKATGKVEGRAEAHGEDYMEEVKRIEAEPAKTTPTEVNAAHDARQKRGLP